MLRPGALSEFSNTPWKRDATATSAAVTMTPGKLNLWDRKLDLWDHKLDLRDRKLNLRDRKLDLWDRKLDLRDRKLDLRDRKLNLWDRKLNLPEGDSSQPTAEAGPGRRLPESFPASLFAGPGRSRRVRPVLKMLVRFPAAGQPHWRRHSLVSWCSNSLLALSLPLKPPRSPVISDILFEKRPTKARRRAGRAWRSEPGPV
jgi:hypothetical protein